MAAAKSTGFECNCCIVGRFVVAFAAVVVVVAVDVAAAAAAAVDNLDYSVCHFLLDYYTIACLNLTTLY
jgi:hypothetical protein